MAGLRVHTVMPAELVARIDAALTDGVSRGEFVRRAVERALESTGADDVAPPRFVPAPTPAEQLVGAEQRPATGVGGGSPGVSKASLPAAAEQPWSEGEWEAFRAAEAARREAELKAHYGTASTGRHRMDVALPPPSRGVHAPNCKCPVCS